MQEPWKTDKWYTSLWNHLPEARKNTNFQKNLKIHDVTLRDGEQQTGVVFRREEKVAIAKKLDAMGIHRIEAGMPAVSEQDKAADRPGIYDREIAALTEFRRTLPKVRRALARSGQLGRALYVERGTMKDAVVKRLADKADDCAPYFAIVLVPGWEGRP